MKPACIIFGSLEKVNSNCTFQFENLSLNENIWNEFQISTHGDGHFLYCVSVSYHVAAPCALRFLFPLNLVTAVEKCYTGL